MDYGECYADEFFEWLAVEYLDALEDRQDNGKEPLNAEMSYARCVIWTAMWRWTLKVAEGNSLSIYGQSQNTGYLYAGRNHSNSSNA